MDKYNYELTELLEEHELEEITKNLPDFFIKPKLGTSPQLYSVFVPFKKEKMLG